ncbi:PREDICTED: SH2 domain-containing protein 4A [Chaetura pelagica]|uniref:SH2 domain-containing protein 4A n=1 Tax=Chaetura pelagica TaxID=8897 RepID=UPI000523155B|nr:PREDICTED: SH2 domain-containing protein 4A [Chaetura pelagica]
MLKQILSDMYIDPDLLAELSEEQKQILFFKMRQEQIRRWEEREAAEDKATAKRPLSRKANGKMVTWKLGADNDVWVWVMGEHPSDKSYEAICEEIQAQRAKQLVREQGTEDRENDSSVTWPLHPQPEVLSEKNLQRKKKSTVVEKKEYGRNTAAATGEKSQELKKRETRDVHQMLADCHMRKHGFQQMKEAQRRNSEEATATQDAIPQSHPSLESQRTLQKTDENEPEWQESLRKSRAADEKRRSLAQQARDDYRRLSLQGIHRGKQADISKGATARDRRPLQYPPLPPKPKLLPPAVANGRVIRKEGIQRTISNSTEESIIKWFKQEQFPLRAGYQKTTDRIAPWFHGILTSKKAEELLNKTVPGSFLVRVSEKIKGYVLSYRSEEKCKHFLIDASSDSYSFLGVDQLQHATLADLVDYHKEEPITSLGKELLLYPCGQEDQEPDYICLFE